MSDSKQQQQLPVAAARLKSIRSEEFRDIYSNFSRLGVTPFDFSVTFSRLIEPTMGVNVIEDEVVVRMSAQQFKTFLESATKTLAAWEEAFGQIKLTVRPSHSSATIEDGIQKLKEMMEKGAV